MNTDRTETVVESMVPTELHDRTDYLFCKLADTLKRSTDATFAHAGIRGAHHALLRVLSSRGPLPQKDLTAALHVDQSTVVDLVDQLEHMALVVRQRNPDDRRSYLLQLTPDGVSRLDNANKLSETIQDTAFAALDTAERATLRAILLKLATIET